MSTIKKAFLLTVALVMPTIAFAQSSIQPGLWETTTKPYDIVLPNVPPQFALKVRNSGKTTVFRQCVTPTQAKLGPQVIWQDNPGSPCRSTHLDGNSNQVHGIATCTNSDGTKSKFNFTATFANDTSFTLDGTMQVPGSGVNMKVSGSGKRIGACE